jgi:excisionase family DNA binding protein
MTDIEILQFGEHEYISFEDAGHYLSCTTDQARDYVYLGKLRAEQVGSRWLIDWESVKDFAKKRGQKPRVG